MNCDMTRFSQKLTWPRHVKLEEESSFLTTFETYFGRYIYICLPFGINGAPDYFQKIFVRLFKDCLESSALPTMW